MSAFLLNTAAWSMIADALADPGRYKNTALDGALKGRPLADVLAEWRDANERAIASRYGRATLAEWKADVGWDVPVALSKVVAQRWEAREFTTQCRDESPAVLAQHIKVVQCLRYQCSEDIPRKHKKAHDRAMADMNSVLRDLGERLAESLPEYKDAKWG